MPATIKLVICDDSPLMRKLLAKMLSADATIQVVAEAENGEQCLAKIAEHSPDVVLLDLAMPQLDGLETLRQAKARNLDTAFLVVSTKAVKDAPATLDALKEGAVDFITKAQGMLQMESIQSEVLSKVKNAAEARWRNQRGAAAPDPTPSPAPAARPAVTGTGKSLTVLGGSAGCMQVLPGILSALPEKIGGALVLILKLPPFLTRQIPVQFGKSTTIPIEVATAGQPLSGGRIYVAPGGDTNLTFERDPTGKRVVFKLEPPAEKAAEGTPSIDAAMAAAAKLFRDSTRGVLISGTGKDGLEGLRAIMTAGGETVIQDRTTAMAPQLVIAAAEAGLAQRTLSPGDIAALLAAR